MCRIGYIRHQRKLIALEAGLEPYFRGFLVHGSCISYIFLMRDHKSKYPVYNCPQSHPSSLSVNEQKTREHHAKRSHSELKATSVHTEIEAIHSPVQDSERNMADLENRATGRLGISKVKPNCQTYVE